MDKWALESDYPGVSMEKVVSAAKVCKDRREVLRALRQEAFQVPDERRPWWTGLRSLYGRPMLAVCVLALVISATEASLLALPLGWIDPHPPGQE